MLAKSFKVNSKAKLSEQICHFFPFLSYNYVMKLLRNKDVKLNGKRVSKDVYVDVNSEVIIYIDDRHIKNEIDIVYEDENIVVVYKKRKIEVVSNEELRDTIETILSSQLNQKCYAVHRLDMNTIGLVVFAKNKESKKLLEQCFKERSIDKYYLALIYSKPHKDSDNMIAYLKKDENNSFVKISNIPQSGYEKIETNYSVIKSYGEFSLVEIKILTGKTHQIRAHFAHIGHPVLGDSKYGDFAFNKKNKQKFQCLCSYKMVFHFNSDSLLFYLDNKTIELDKSKIDFLSLCEPKK